MSVQPHCTQAGIRASKSPAGYNFGNRAALSDRLFSRDSPASHRRHRVGYLGRFHAQKYAALSDSELVGVVDTDPERLAAACEELEVPGFTDYREILGQVDAASIVVPTAKHYEITRACLEADCHVLVEKPFTSSVEEATGLIELARQKQRIVQVGLLEAVQLGVLRPDAGA